MQGLNNDNNAILMLVHLINSMFNTGENISFELSPEARQELGMAAEVADMEDEGNTEDCKPVDGMQRPPPPTLFW